MKYLLDHLIFHQALLHKDQQTFYSYDAVQKNKKIHHVHGHAHHAESWVVWI